MKKLVLLLVSFLFINIAAYSQPINFSWAKTMGGSGGDGSVGLAKDATGNLYVTGEFIGTRSFGPFSLTAEGNSDVFVAKYSPTGTCLWAIRGGSPFAAAYAGKIAVSGNQVFVTGSFTSVIAINGLSVSSSGTKDIFIAGLDAANGNCTWLDKAGSVFDDIPHGIEVAAGGGFYLCGTFTGTATFGAYTVASSSIVDFDIFYAKYDAAGTCTWVNRIGSTGKDIAYAIKQMPAGDLLITGSFENSVQFGPGTTLTSFGFTDLFLAKFTSGGVFSWATSGGCDLNDDVGRDLSFDPAGNVYVTGYIGDTATFGSLVFNNSGGINVFVAKFSPTGTCLWGNNAGINSDDMGNGIVTDFGGSSYVTGYVNGSCYFGTTLLSGVNYVDVFIVKYNSAGVLRWITKAGAAQVDRGKAILLDVNGFCHVAGDYTDNVVFGTIGLISDPGTSGVFLTKVGGGTVGVDEIEKQPFTMYPNPAQDFVQLDLQEIADDAFTLSLYTLDGKLALTQLLSRNDAVTGYKLNLASFATGNYLLKLETSKGDFSRTLVVQ